MKYLVESEFYWSYRNVKSFAKNNVVEAKKIVKKNKEGIESLISQGVGEDKIISLGETDKHLLTALYILIYLEDSSVVSNGKTIKEFLEDLFGKSIEAIIPDKEIFKESVKKIIINPKRGPAWKGEDKKAPSFEDIPIIGKKDTPKKEKELPKEENKKNGSDKKLDQIPTSNNTNDAVDDNDNDNGDDDDDDDTINDNPLKDRVEDLKKRDTEKSSSNFETAIANLTSKKNLIFAELDNLIKTSNNPVPLGNAKANIEANFIKRIKNIQKAQNGATPNPKLRLQQEIAIANSFMERTLLIAKKSQMPNTLQRGALAIRDMKDAVGREVKSGVDAVKGSYVGRKVSQKKEDSIAKRINAALGNKKMEKYIYSKSEKERKDIYDETLKKEAAKRASTEEKTKEEIEAEKLAREKEFTKTKAQKDRENKVGKKTKEKERIVSSTDVSNLPSLNESIKQKIKNNIKKV